MLEHWSARSTGPPFFQQDHFAVRSVYRYRILTVQVWSPPLYSVHTSSPGSPSPSPSNNFDAGRPLEFTSIEAWGRGGVIDHRIPPHAATTFQLCSAPHRPQHIQYRHQREEGERGGESEERERRDKIRSKPWPALAVRCGHAVGSVNVGNQEM